MPEGPEIEVMRQGLLPLEGARLRRLVMHRDHRKVDVSRAQARRLEGSRLVRLHRHGKRLCLQFDRGQLVVGAGMSGYWRLPPHGYQHRWEKHDIFSLETSRGIATFNDARRFGSAHYFAPGDLSWTADLGVDGFDPRLVRRGRRELVHPLFERLSRWELKVALLDQRALAGLGNIYAAEVLWRIRAHPQTRVSDFDGWAALARTSYRVLHAAVRGGGTMIQGANPYKTADGRLVNGFPLAVYGRAGQPCYRCEAPIEQITQAGRSTFFCPHCQTGG